MRSESVVFLAGNICSAFYRRGPGRKLAVCVTFTRFYVIPARYCSHVDVVAFLPRQLLSHLRIVLGSEHSLTSVASWAELQALAQHQALDLVVADPSAAGTVQFEALELLRRQFPSLPVVVYTSLAPATIKAIVRLAKSGVEHVVLSRFDDEPGRFLDLLEGIPAQALGDMMLQELAGPLSSLPVGVIRAIDQLFRSPTEFKNASDLAAAAGMNLRTLYRNLEPAGIFSARSLVVAARLLRAYAYLQDPGRSIKDVAAKAGYHSPWQLSQQMRELTGQTTEQVRKEVTGRALVSLLAEEVRRRRRKQ
jgi:AraC-like DNA-binding protein/CheY-like chemotaxis protein